MKLLFNIIILSLPQIATAQQGSWLDLPSAEIKIEYHYTDKDELDSVRYSNGATASWGYDAMANWATSFQAAAPPKAELLCSKVYSPDTFGIGGVLPIKARIDNEGVISASSFSMGVYVSTNLFFDASDALVSAPAVVANIPSADTILRALTIGIPLGTTPGNAYFLYYPDQPNGVVEYSDTNNIYIQPVVLVPCTITTLTDTINTATCGYANGSIHVRNLSAAGYKYLWQDGADLVSREHLSAGNYTLSITDRKGCVSVSAYTIGDTPPVQAQFSTTPATCAQANASATLSTTSGTAPFTYLWSTGNTGATLSQVNAGYYAYTISDAVGCMAIGSLSLDAIPTPVVALDATDANCGGSNGNINSHILIGTAPYTYAWNTGATSAQLSGLTEGIYSVTLTDANTCTTTETIQVYSSPALGVTVQSSGSLLVAQAVQGVSPYQFQWSTGSHNNNISNAGGLYTLTVTDANGCTATWSNAQTGVPDINTHGISLTPNPTNGIVRLSYESLPAGALVKIYSLNGDLVIEKPLTNLSNSEVQFDLSNLPNQSLQLVIWSNEQVMLYSQSIVLSK